MPNKKTEAVRLRELKRLEILDTPADPAFDIFTEIAKDIFSVPISAISLIDKNRQWFKSVEGLNVTEIPIEVSFCRHVIASPEGFMVVEDATKDPRFKDNAIVKDEPRIRFYAGASVYAPNGIPIGALCVIDTVPKKFSKKMQSTLKKMAFGVSSAVLMHQNQNSLNNIQFSDTVTPAWNKAFIHSYLNQITKLEKPATIFQINLDNFKMINELFGHQYGDIVLLEVFLRLKKVTRTQGVIARNHADEFMVIYPGNSLTKARIIAHNFLKLFEKPFGIASKEINLHASIGVVVTHQTDYSTEILLQRVDSALHRAKSTGGNKFHFLEEKDMSAIGRKSLSEMMKKAFSSNGHEPFILHYQPYFKTKDGKLSGFEALVRWPMQDRLIPPGDFIPVAEADGSIMALDRWVLKNACMEAQKWPEHLSVSINVSSASFVVVNFFEEVCQIILETGIKPSRLKLEVTEGVMLPDIPHIIETMKQLKKIGVRLALDDFGCGYASLGYVKEYPFDVMKVDRSFINDIANDGKSLFMLKTILQLGTALGLETVAEGVETQEQMDILKMFETDLIQGYLTGRPLPQEKARDLANSLN